MATLLASGRDREIAEIVALKRAAEVGRLLLGELHGPLPRVAPDQFEDWPRKKVKAAIDHFRAKVRGELKEFCDENFVSASYLTLARLYEPHRMHRQ